MVQLLQIAEMRNSPVGALTFGIELPNGKVAYPAAPTWIAYAGDHQHCMDDIPIAITTHRCRLLPAPFGPAPCPVWYDARL